MELRHDNYFPSQRVSNAEKSKASWFTNCIDFVISAGLSYNSDRDYETRVNILHGDIPDSFYKKTLNPYNASQEKYRRFPATMRNLDIMSDIIRRYVSEYIKGEHDFIVSSNDPEIIINKEAKLKAEVLKLAYTAFAEEFKKRYEAAIQQNGGNQEQIDPQSIMPDVEQFIKDFEEKYIDDKSEQGQKLLNYIRSITKDDLKYIEAYFNYVAFGECYSYSTVEGNNIVKETVPLNEAYPVPNSSFFVEDHDMFARRLRLTYQQIMDKFDEYLTDKDRKYLKDYYDNGNSPSTTRELTYSRYFEDYADVCEKFSEEERNFFKDNTEKIFSENGLYDVWHVVWRGNVKIGILTCINEIGFESRMVVEDGFKFDKSLGHINIEWKYIPQIYEGYRIGTRQSGIYPIKARAINYGRHTKLPYNGVMEILPMFGKFSIVDIVTPFQILRNIFSYHREMVIAKNKLLILIMPESLLGSGGDDTEDKIYKMAAEGILPYDDSIDSNSLKAQQIRLLNANLGQYITEITNLMEAIKNEARELVDMTAQRYGEIANSAGVGTTREAINRGSMGTVVVNYVFDKYREADYNRDLDYAKFAFIDGLQAGYFEPSTKQQEFISLDANALTNSDLGVTVKVDAKEKEKLDQLRQWAFSAAQNGDLDMALAAITSDNIASAKKAINNFIAIKQKHEQEMQQAEQIIKEEELQAKLQQIAAEGEEDRKTQELKYYYEMQMKYIDIDLGLLNSSNTSDVDKNNLTRELEQSKQSIEQQKIQLERERMMYDNYNAAAERNVKREDIASKERIAKTNKNRYDK